MGAIASQITSHTIVFNRLFRRRSKKTSKLGFTGLCVGNSPGPVKSPNKGPVTRKMFPFDDFIMNPSGTESHVKRRPPGARPTNDIWIEFKIRPKFQVMLFKMYSTDHNEVLHTSWQCNCRNVCKISLGSVDCILNLSTVFLLNFEFDRNTVSRTGARYGIFYKFYRKITAGLEDIG